MATQRTPVQERSIQTRQAILKAGAELFRQKGYHAVTSKEIAAKAGVSTGSFYSYYPDKRVLFLEALQASSEAYNERFRELFKDVDFRRGHRLQAMKNIFEGMVEAHDMFGEMHRSVEVLQLSDEEMLKWEREEAKIGVATALSTIKAGRFEADVRDPQTAATIIYELSRTIIGSIIDERYEISKERMIAGLAEATLRILGVDEEKID